MSRPIVQVATFVGPRSGGIRTVLGQLAAGYAAAGHEVVQIVPGPARAVTPHPWGARIELPGRLVPRTGYRLMSARAVAQELPALDPLRLEVHDRGTLRALGGWAREHGVPSCAVSHERLDRLMAQWTNGHGPVDRVADRSNRALAEQFDAIVCTTPWAAEEFDRLAIDNLHQVPLGVDAAVFRPAAASAALRDRWAPQGEVLLALATRLSPEKRPELAVECVAELVRRGVPARLVVAGDGPLRGRLRRLTSALPVRLVGHVPDPAMLAALLATADVVLAPGPVETFGLAALEALACGTPVVVNERSALPGVVGPAGVAVHPTGAGYADGVEQVLRRPTRRADARARAVPFTWARTVEGFLRVHGLEVGVSV